MAHCVVHTVQTPFLHSPDFHTPVTGYVTRDHKYKEKKFTVLKMAFSSSFCIFSLSGRVLFFVLLNWEGEEDDGNTEVQTTRAWEGG